MSFDRKHRPGFGSIFTPDTALKVREALRIGAYGFKHYANRDLAMGFGVALLLHLSLLSFDCAFIDDTSQQPDTVMTGPVEFTEFGGSGGMKDVDAPLGLTPKGDPKGRAATHEGDEQHTKPIPKPPSGGSNTPEGHVVPTNKKPPQTGQKNPNTTPPQNSGGTDNGAQTTEGGPAHGTDQGTGTQPAGGSGGITVGDGGLGRNRCWERSPSGQARGAKSNEKGIVEVSFTVKWDGRVTNVRKVSGPTALFNKARQLLANVKACPATADTPDVSLRLRYNFKGG